MQRITVLAACLVGSASALRPAAKQLHSTTRRAAIGGLFALPFAAQAAEWEGGGLGATCLGFGCNPYGRTDFNGMPAEEAPPNSITYQDFLKAIKEKRVTGVVFQPPSGDEAYAIVDGKSIRVGEGWPVEVSNSWSSPTWVVRILENEDIPYAWNFNLKAKGSYKDKMKKPIEAYKPGFGRGASVLDSASADGGGFTAQPKMYGGVDAAMDKSAADYAGNFK